MEKRQLEQMAAFGVAGNFTGHLEQAGEAVDFTQIKTNDASAPKAMFPTYLPKQAPEIPAYLSVYPFDDQVISYPMQEEKLQIEPECAIVFQLVWEGDTIKAMKPMEFGASNDCSIRKEGAKKISQKKNWGASSKGFSSQRIALDSFLAGSVLDRYKIASFLVRDGIAHTYGETSWVKDYSYIYEKLTDWMLEKLNHQKDEGPAEDIHRYLCAADKPEYIMVSIGATRYSEYGVSHFLEKDDLSVVVVYPADRYREEDIVKLVEKGTYQSEEASFLVQKIVMEEAETLC